MVTVVQSTEFRDWLRSLSDARTRAKIAARIARLKGGNPGDVKPIGEGLSEMRIHHGAGYRVYFMKHNETVIVLLCGGDKSSQSRDIADAKHIATEWRRRHP